jgi:antitoxin VapB
MNVNVAEILKDGQNQVVKLPEEFNIDDDKVYVNKIGNAVVLLPFHDPWRPLFDSLDKFSDDFMEERKQPKEQSREDLFK